MLGACCSAEQLASVPHRLHALLLRSQVLVAKKHPAVEYCHSVLNEWFVMRLAKRLGLDVPLRSMSSGLRLQPKSKYPLTSAPNRIRNALRLELKILIQTAIGAAIEGSASYPSNEKSSNVNANRSFTSGLIFITGNALGVRASCVATCSK